MENNMENEQIVVKKKSKKGIIITTALVLVMALALVIIMLGNNYEGVIKENVKLFNTHETAVDEFDKFSNVVGINDANKAFYDKLDIDMPNLEEHYEKSIEALKEKFGEDYTLSYEIIKSKKLNRVEKESVKEGLNKCVTEMSTLIELIEKDIALYCTYFNAEEEDLEVAVTDMKAAIEKLKDAKCSAAYSVELNCRVEGNDVSSEFKYEVVLAKVDGEWKILENTNGIYRAVSFNPLYILSKIEN